MMKKHLFSLALFLGLASAVAQPQLDSQQQRSLKDAEYYMNQGAKDFQALTQFAQGLKALPDPSVVALSKLQQERLKFRYTRQKLGNAERRLKMLPADHPTVKEMTEALTGFLKRMESDEQVFADVQTQLEKVQDPATWPDFNRDLETLRGMTTMFAFPEMLRTKPERMAKALAQWEEVQAFFQGLKKYQPLINQGTDAGNKIGMAVNEHSAKIEAFRTAAAQFIAATPNELDACLKQATEMADESVRIKNPRLAQVGAEIQLQQAEARVSVLNALMAKHAPEDLKRHQEKVGAARAKLDKTVAALKEEIIASNAAPQDNYQGRDKAKLIEMVRAKWTETYPRDLILGIRITMSEWDRTVAWRMSSVELSWYKEDSSELQARVVVKTGDRLATSYLAYLVKDHLKNDKVKLTLGDKNGVSTRQQMLVANWK